MASNLHEGNFLNQSLKLIYEIHKNPLLNELLKRYFKIQNNNEHLCLELNTYMISLFFAYLVHVRILSFTIQPLVS